MSFKKRRISDETRRKMSEANKGRVPWNKGKTGVYSEKIRSKMGEANKGHRRSPGTEFKKNQKPHNKGKKNSEATRGKISMTLRGRKLSEEHKRKLSMTLRGRKLSEEHKRKLAKSWFKKGHKPSAVTRKKISKAGKGRKPWNKGKTGIYSEKTLKKWSESRKGKTSNMKGKKHTKEAKQKMSQSGKKFYANGGNPWNKGKTGVYSENHIMQIRTARAKQRLPKKDSKPEKFLQKLCKEAEIKFQTQKVFNLGFQNHAVDLFIEPNICVEVDGDFYHANPNDYMNKGTLIHGLKHDKIISSSSTIIKTAKWVRENDAKITQALEQQDNVVLRFWQSELEQNPEKCLQKIIKIIKEARKYC